MTGRLVAWGLQEMGIMLENKVHFINIKSFLEMQCRLTRLKIESENKFKLHGAMSIQNSFIFWRQNLPN